MPDKDRFWTEDRVRILREMHVQMFSPHSIAEALGTTRNAVLGKSHRLGLRRQIKRTTEPTVARMRGVSYDQFPAPGRCLWPLDDGKWCNAKAHGQYCEHHRSIAYVNPLPKLDVDYLSSIY